MHSNQITQTLLRGLENGIATLENILTIIFFKMKHATIIQLRNCSLGTHLRKMETYFPQKTMNGCL